MVISKTSKSGKTHELDESSLDMEAVKLVKVVKLMNTVKLIRHTPFPQKLIIDDFGVVEPRSR